LTPYFPYTKRQNDMTKPLRNPTTGQFVDEREAEELARIHAADRAHALETAQRLLDDPEYDGPEVIMLSTGYAEVYRDGDVVQHRLTVFSVAEDLDQ